MAIASRLYSNGNFLIENTGVFDEVTGLTGKTTQQNNDGTHLISGLYDEVTLPATITNFSTYASQFNGTTQRLTTSANSVTTQNFTMECWFYMTSNITYLDGTPNYSARVFGTANVNGFELLIGGGASSTPTSIQFNNVGPFQLSCGAYFGSSIGINQWHHVAVSRNGTSFALWLDGIRVATTTSSFNFTAGAIYIAAAPNGSYQDWFPGRISNVRIVRGSVVYDPSLTTITVPTAPLTAITNTYLLTCQSATNIDNSGNGFTITPVASPTISAVTVPAIPDVIIPARRQYSNGDYFINGTFDEVTGDLTFGDVIFDGSGYRSDGGAAGTYSTNNPSAYSYYTFNWTAPAGVTSVSVVAIGGGYSGGPSGYNRFPGDSFFINSSTVWGQAGGAASTGQIGTAPGGGYAGDGGGTGGSRNLSGASTPGAGAGGYSGTGGNYNAAAVTGSGGGAGGGASSTRGGGGGGVGLYGIGSNGTYPRGGGSGGSAGGDPTTTPGAGGLYGGGGGGNNATGGSGAGLGWKNNITVVPGTTYTVQAGSGGSQVGGGGNGAIGAVRIMWGAGRSFPSNAP